MQLLGLYVKEGELSDDPDCTFIEQEQQLSEEQTYRETMKGIRSFMGWSHIPDIDSTANTSEDNPFAIPKAPVPGKVSVQMPTEDWLCQKFAKLNLSSREERVELKTTPHNLPRASSRINDIYCVTKLQERLLTGCSPRKTLTVPLSQRHVKFPVVTLVYSATGPPQRKGISPGAGFMKGLKSGLRLKSETLGSNIVNILLSLWTQTQSISQTGST